MIGEWIIHSLIDERNLLLRDYALERNPEKKAIIMTTVRQTEINISDIRKRNLDGQIKISNSELGKLFRIMTPYYERILAFYNQVAPRINNNYFDSIPLRGMENDDSLLLCEDFFKNLNSKNVWNSFANLFAHHDQCLKFTDKDNLRHYGFSWLYPYLGKCFIAVRQDIGIEKLIVTIHEYGHGITIFNKCMDFNTLYELIPSFFELIGFEYLARFFDEDTIFNIKYNELSRNYQRANIILAAFKINELKAKNIPIELYLQDTPLERDTFDKIINDPSIVYSSFIYLIAYLFAIDMFRIYLVDKQKALFILQQIMQCNGHNEMKNVSKIIGINPDDRQYVNSVFTHQ